MPGLPDVFYGADILPTAETDTSLVLAPDGAGGVEFRAETGGGGGSPMSRSFVGYNTIGGTWTAVVADRHYMKKITLATDSLLSSIDVHLRSNANAITGLSPILTTDAAGVPDHLIIPPYGRGNGMVFQETSSGAQPGRWVSFPIGVWLPAGDYWIGFLCTGAGVDVANDGSGSDVYWTSGGSYASGTYYNSGKTTGSVKYSIRGSLITGGGAGPLLYPLDRPSFDGTYGDDFDEASLNARWSRHVQTSGEESYQIGGVASSLRVAYSTAAAARYIYQTAPNGTNETWECSISQWQVTGTNQMFGLLMVDSSGNGVAALVYDNSPGIYIANVASHGYSSVGASAVYNPVAWQAGQRLWLRLRKATGAYSASFSLNGETYSPEVTFTPSAFTPTRVGVGRILGTTAGDTLDIHWFDKTA
jgi:hypothetical protein